MEKIYLVSEETFVDDFYKTNQGVSLVKSSQDTYYSSTEGFKPMKQMMKDTLAGIIMAYDLTNVKYRVLYKNFKRKNGEVGFKIAINDPVFGEIITKWVLLEIEAWE